MDEQERQNLWTAIDNLQSAFSTLVSALEDHINAQDRDWIDECIKIIVGLL